MSTKSQMIELTASDIAMISGGNGEENPFETAATGFAAASLAARAVALIPSPATPALTAFSVVTGGLALAFGYAATKTS